MRVQEGTPPVLHRRSRSQCSVGAPFEKWVLRRDRRRCCSSGAVFTRAGTLCRGGLSLSAPGGRKGCLALDEARPGVVATQGRSADEWTRRLSRLREGERKVGSEVQLEEVTPVLVHPKGPDHDEDLVAIMHVVGV